tara:strand:+ start:309 stop:494 length:186 start_codon:yes stop_codon:yes gene_type:complete
MSILKADTKKIIISKSKYEQVNKTIVDSYLSRINDNYDVIILHKENTIEIKITLKNSIGRA